MITYCTTNVHTVVVGEIACSTSAASAEVVEDLLWGNVVAAANSVFLWEAVLLRLDCGVVDLGLLG